MKITTWMYNTSPNYHLLDGGDNVVIGTLGQPRLFTVSYSYSF